MILLGLAASVIVGIIPTILYAGFIYWLDRHEKEPWWLLLLSFVWGAVPAVIAALISQILLDIPTTWVLDASSQAYQILGSSIWAPVTEELAKGFGVLVLILLASREIDSILDGLILGALCGLGFALSENVLYFTSAVVEEGWESWFAVVLLRTIPFGLNHALFTGLTGAGAAAAHLSKKGWVKFIAPIGGLLAGILFHSIHNLGASLSGEQLAPLCASFIFDWGGLALLGLLILLVWRQEKRWIAEHLADELDEKLFVIMTSWVDWQNARWSTLLRGDLAGWQHWRQLRQTATEMAFKKQRLTQRGPDPKTEQDIIKYRRRLEELIKTVS
ncbi:MAG: PrsW family intramembrane metalloprotease [Anaerolineales bacterium]|nr:PrsW family intramembrane metalloprotease [Anaerolineales bacterium]